MPDYVLALSSAGCPTLHDRASGETLHRNLGACAEARAVYAVGCNIEGLLPEHSTDLHKGSRSARVCDLGLGGGFNALSAIEAACKNPELTDLELHSFDLTLAGLRLTCQHREAFAEWDAIWPWATQALEAFETSPAASAVMVSRELCFRAAIPRQGSQALRLTWTYYQGDAFEFLGSHETPLCYDAMFYDMFSWKTSPSLWTQAALACAVRHLGPKGIVATYSGATAVRASLLSLGLFVGEGAAVAPSMRATLASRALESIKNPLNQAWLKRFQRSQRPFLESEPEATRHTIRMAVEQHPQFVQTGQLPLNVAPSPARF